MATVTQERHPASRSRTALAALVGWMICGIALGVAVGVTQTIERVMDLAPSAVAVVQAVLMCALTVPAIVLLRRRVDRRSVTALGLSRRLIPPIGCGMLVGVLSALFVWVPALAAGWIRIDGFDGARFVVFLLFHGLVLALYEAIPEEIALRGYVWTNLRDGWGLVLATFVTTVLFTLIGAVVGPVRWATVTLLGGDDGTFRIFPAGVDPVEYIVHLALFGLAVIAARRIPMEGALFIAIAFHWTYLTITRALLGGMGWAGSGLEVSWVEPDAIVLFLVQIVVAGVAFVILRRRRERSSRRLSRETDGRGVGEWTDA